MSLLPPTLAVIANLVARGLSVAKVYVKPHILRYRYTDGELLVPQPRRPK